MYRVDQNKVDMTKQMRSFKRGYVFELCFILIKLFTKHLHIKNPKYFRYFEMCYNVIVTVKTFEEKIELSYLKY